MSLRLIRIEPLTNFEFEDLVWVFGHELGVLVLGVENEPAVESLQEVVRSDASLSDGHSRGADDRCLTTPRQQLDPWRCPQDAFERAFEETPSAPQERVLSMRSELGCQVGMGEQSAALADDRGVVPH